MTHYELLGVTSDASLADIKAAWRRLARGNHPDLVAADAREESSQRMAAINHAYEILSDTEKRAHYDRTGQDPSPARDSTRQAEEEIMNMVAEFLDAEEDYEGDLVLLMRQSIAMRKKDALTELGKVKHSIMRIEKRANRIKGAIIARVTQHKVRILKERQAQVEDECAHLDKVMALLQDYKDTESTKRRATTKIELGSYAGKVFGYTKA